ncbi:MAG: repressor LexA [Clostridia bacterium]|nr:repressor LexA [Clostridia bacterium]MBQ5717422.1 repressor LexA [Clostridia bacterium]
MRTKNSEYFIQIEEFIKEYYEKNGISPSMREISQKVGISCATVQRYLSTMRDEGRIKYSGHRSITSSQSVRDFREILKVPVLGRVSCGLPKYAEENIEEYINLPTSIFGNGNFYILYASGDSMIEAGINDGDMVLIRVQNTADVGDIVVALIDDEVTLKRYYPDPVHKRIRLHPENRSMKDIIVSDCIVQGVAVKLIKDLS